MIRAPLWQVAEKGKPASLKILNVQKLLGQEPTKSRVVPPAAGFTGEFKTVEQQDPLLSSQTITIKATRIFSWPVKPKPAGDPTTFDVRWLLISSPDSWSRKV